ncbi:hypothetical protein ACHWQZ_G012659 [Mnemiopsis leidyi]
MKILLVLLSLLVLSRAHHEEELIGEFTKMMRDPMDWIIEMITETFLDENGELKRELLGMMPRIESQICPEEASGQECQSSDNWLFGCKCVKEFGDLERSCSMKPCELFRNLKEKGAISLSKIANAESNHEKTRTLMDVITPGIRALCECPDIISASISCVRKYDGQLFEMQMAGMNKTTFDYVVANIEWRALKSVLSGFIDAVCLENNGKDCVTEFTDSYAAYGTFMDNSERGEDVCFSLVRLQDQYDNYLNTLNSFNIETESIKSFLDRVADAYLEVERKLLCDRECAGEISQGFYSCCRKHAYELLTTEEMKKKYNKLLKSLLNLLSDSDKSPRKLINVVDKFLEFTDPEAFCGDETDVYREKNQECAAAGI